MKLTELEPRWWGLIGRHGQGMLFLCPHCLTEYLGIAFANPLDGGLAVPEEIRKYTNKKGEPKVQPLWNRQGDEFENITITPSIDASEIGHWHGFITNGEIIN